MHYNRIHYKNQLYQEMLLVGKRLLMIISGFEIRNIGQGDETVLLTDSASIHVGLVCTDRTMTSRSHGFRNGHIGSIIHPCNAECTPTMIGAAVPLYDARHFRDLLPKPLIWFLLRGLFAFD